VAGDEGAGGAWDEGAGGAGVEGACDAAGADFAEQPPADGSGAAVDGSGAAVDVCGAAVDVCGAAVDVCGAADCCEEVSSTAGFWAELAWPPEQGEPVSRMLFACWAYVHPPLTFESENPASHIMTPPNAPSPEYW
jgi:hypothetical protein